MTAVDQRSESITLLADPNGAHEGSAIHVGHHTTVRCHTCRSVEGQPLVVAYFADRANADPDRAAKLWRKHIVARGPNQQDRRPRIVQAIRDHIGLHGYAPTIREIGDAVGLVSPSSVAHQLRQLANAGVLRFDTDTPRSIVLLDGPCAHCGAGDAS